MDLTPDNPKTEPDHNRENDPPQAVVQLDRQAKKSVSPPQNPPPARLRSTAESSTKPASTRPAPKPVLPPGPEVVDGLPSAPQPNLVDTLPPRLSGQRPDGPAVALEERARAAGSRPVTPNRVDEWVTTVQTAMQGAANPPASRPIALAEVSPTPKMGWSYRVQRGDNLWRISSQLWTDGSSHHDVDRTWRMLYEWNRDVLGPDSDRIYPGQILEIPADAANVTTTSSGASSLPIAKDVAR
jgi:nucleoid-associated protein YgaU